MFSGPTPEASLPPCSPSGLFIFFQAAGKTLALRSHEVQRLVLLPTLLEVPGLPPVVQGFFPTPHGPVPVLDLGLLLSPSPTEKTAESVLLLLQHQGQAVAYLADRAVGLGQATAVVAPGAGSQRPKVSAESLGQSFVRWAEEEIPLLNPADLFGSYEAQVSAALRRLVADRAVPLMAAQESSVGPEALA